MKIRIPLFFVAVLFAHVLHAQNSRRAQSAATIQNHIKNTLLNGGTYKGFDFGSLEEIKPKAYLQLEELISVKKTLPSMRSHYTERTYDSIVVANDSAIQRKKREIMRNNIRPEYQMNHTFMITDKDGNYTGYNIDFTVSYNYTVTDVHLRYSVPLDKDQVKDYYYFEKRIPMYEGSDAYRNAYASNQIYDQFDKGLKASNYDTEIIYSLLRVIHVIRDKGYLDMDKLGQLAIQDWITQNGSDLEAYKKEDYSYMYEINKESDGKNTLIGYKMFHKYTFKDRSGERITDVVYFEFDTYFVIRGILAVPEPYDEYFKKE